MGSVQDLHSEMKGYLGKTWEHDGEHIGTWWWSYFFLYLSRDTLWKSNKANWKTISFCKSQRTMGQFSWLSFMGYTLWLFNIAMENDPFIDGLPMNNGDFPQFFVCLPEGIMGWDRSNRWISVRAVDFWTCWVNSMASTAESSTFSNDHRMGTLWLFNIAMENGPFIDGLPIKNGDFPWLC